MRNVETRDESIIEYALKKVMLALIVNYQPQTTHSMNIQPNLPQGSYNITALHVILCDFLIATGMHICFFERLSNFFYHSGVKGKLREICHRT
jgi:hypothetical protein